jgi:hypothetical protein
MPSRYVRELPSETIEQADRGTRTGDPLITSSLVDSRLCRKLGGECGSADLTELVGRNYGKLTSVLVKTRARLSRSGGG